MVQQAEDRVDPLEIVESASIYELTEGAIILDTIFEECTNEETGEIQILNGYFEARVKIGELTEDKIEAICKTVQNYRAKETRIAEAVAELTEVLDNIPLVKSLREEIERLSGRKRTMENRVDKVKELLKWYLQTTGQKSVETGTFRVWRQKNGMPSVDADLAELEKWPLCYLRLQPDKRAVGAAWKKEQRMLARCKNCGTVAELHGKVFAAETRWLRITEEWEDGSSDRAFHMCSGDSNVDATDEVQWTAQHKACEEDGVNFADHVFPAEGFVEGVVKVEDDGWTWGRGEIYMDPPDIPDDVDITQGEHIRIK